MNKIFVLDCTLRDGGYCNEWGFGFENINTITRGLCDTGVEIIECGFLTNRVEYDPDVSKFTSLEELSRVIPEHRGDKIFVAMMNYGEFDPDYLPEYDGSSIDGIRVAFHKKNLVEAVKICEKIRKKGYLVFVQAMVSLAYSDDEFLSLIHLVNSLKPYAFYIVDSFGMMKDKDLIRLYYMVEHNLDEEIWIGFHSHNNLQLAYSNAQTLTALKTNRNLIIDSSIHGMGRGAGNLNTELFVSYLNDNAGKSYDIRPLLNIIDKILDGFYQQNYWGYSLPNYLSATHNAHPNYASWLDNKKTLTVEDMNEIFTLMTDDKKVEFDKAYIEEIYLKYMEKGKTSEEHDSELRDKLKGKKLLLIAPGKSSSVESEKITRFASSEDVISVGINVDYSCFETDFIFISNLRRYRELRGVTHDRLIVTSNIPCDDAYLQCHYKNLLNEVEEVSDNAGLMAIRFFMLEGVKSVYLAGFDGYSHDIRENYRDKGLELTAKNAVLDAMNEGMKKVLSGYAEELEISFLTEPRHIKIEN